ncbi:MAG: histidine kinase [Phaeodactylibacter sp.]|nr:histidine kinase [Phaeodactylibacter sp.]MCB9301096.1 histidine kinase [Lewinellaceae bacterium]
MKKIILFLLGIITLLSGHGQEPYFREHPVGEAYQDVSINQVLEASNGFLWFGSNQGLLRYDGREYEQFLAPDSLTNNQVRAIFEDIQHRIWVGYEDGRILYLEKGRELELWQLEEGLPTVPVVGFAQNPNGLMWIATYGEGLYYYNGQHLYNINNDDGLLGNDIYTLVQDKEGRAWVGTDGGISICSVQDGKKNIENITRADGLPDDIVRTLLPDKSGNFWVGTYDKGFCYYNTARQVFEFPLKDWKYGPIHTMELFDSLELWVGTEGSGLYRYQLRTGYLQSISKGRIRPATKIYDLHIDIEGNIWIINNEEGVVSANRQFESISNEVQNIQAVFSGRDGKLWVGSQEGLYYFDEASGQFHLYLQENVLSLFQCAYGNLWAGTFGNGVFCIDLKTGKQRHLTEADGLTNNSVLAMDGNDKDVWLATLGGATHVICRQNIMNAEQLEVDRFDEASGLATNFIYTVFLDSKGRTWFGTDGEGLNVLVDGKIRNFKMVNGIPLNAVYSITEDDRGHIWFSTAREGVFEWDGEQFRRLSVKEGLRDRAITSLIADGKGNILIVHPSGIDLLNPLTRHLIYYDSEIGIKNMEPNLNAVCPDGYGGAWIGAQNRLVKYTALQEKLSIHPRIVLNQVSVFLEPIDFWLKSNFSYEENNLVFQYVGLWFTDPSKVKYRYQLEGFDLDWRYSSDQQAVYSSLPPGHYSFKVAATENDAFDDEPMAIYRFVVKAPYWRQWWFIILASLLLAGGAVWAVRTREKRLEQEASLKRAMVESQYEALKSQINPHFLFNSFNTLISIIEENPGLAVEFVEKLSDFYRSILQYREKEVISLQEEIELVKNYAFLLQKRYGSSLQLVVQTDGQQGYIAPLTLQMLVENAVKHNIISKSRPLSIEILSQPEGYIMVRNTLQKKLTQEPSTGFGLHSIINRYQLLSERSLRVEEDGQYFCVCVPVIKNERT